MSKIRVCSAILVGFLMFGVFRSLMSIDQHWLECVVSRVWYYVM